MIFISKVLKHFIKQKNNIHNGFLLKSQGTFVRQNGSIIMTALKIGIFGSAVRLVQKRGAEKGGKTHHLSPQNRPLQTE